MIVMRHKNYAQAFTLIEILVVISILGMLSSIVLVSLKNTREKANIAAEVIFSTHIHRAVGDQGAIYFDFSGESDPDEDLDTEVADTSGNALNGTLVGNSHSNPMVSPTSYSPEAGSSLKLNNRPGVSTQYVSVGSSPALESEKLIISAWVKTIPPSRGNWSSKVIVSYSPVYALYIYGIYGSTNSSAVIFCNDEALCLVANVNIEDDKWHQIVVSVDSGVTNGTAIYVDGKLIKQGTIILEIMPGCDPVLNIGNVQAACGVNMTALHTLYPFIGQLDDVRVYTTSLPVN